MFSECGVELDDTVNSEPKVVACRDCHAARMVGTVLGRSLNPVVRVWTHVSDLTLKLVPLRWCCCLGRKGISDKFEGWSRLVECRSLSHMQLFSIQHPLKISLKLMDS